MSTTLNEDNTPDLAVDDKPISPVERRNSLEKHLQHRPDVQDLKNRHITRALQAKQHELERQQHSDNLRKQLEKRPDREELIERNILPDSNAAPALQATQRSLDKHMRADSLEQKIQQRPKPEQLVKEGILEPDANPLKDQE